MLEGWSCENSRMQLPKKNHKGQFGWKDKALGRKKKGGNVLSDFGSDPREAHQVFSRFGVRARPEGAKVSFDARMLFRW